MYWCLANKQLIMIIIASVATFLITVICMLFKSVLCYVVRWRNLMFYCIIQFQPWNSKPSQNLLVFCLLMSVSLSGVVVLCVVVCLFVFCCCFVCLLLLGFFCVFFVWFFVCCCCFVCLFVCFLLLLFLFFVVVVFFLFFFFGEGGGNCHLYIHEIGKNNVCNRGSKGTNSSFTWRRIHMQGTLLLNCIAPRQRYTMISLN